MYIVFELNNWPRNLTNNFTPENCFSGTVKLTKNGDKSEFIYNGQGIAFDGKETLSFGKGFAWKCCNFWFW